MRYLIKMNNQKGISLLEVVLALVIFSIATGGLFSAFAYSMRMERRAMLQVLASYTAQMKLEEAYGLSAAELNALKVVTNPNATGTVMVEGSGLLSFKYTVTDYDTALHLFTVNVEVTDLIKYGVSVNCSALYYAT